MAQPQELQPLYAPRPESSTKKEGTIKPATHVLVGRFRYSFAGTCSSVMRSLISNSRHSFIEGSIVNVARVLLIASFALASATTLAATDRISADDFVKKAGEAGAAEVTLGKLGAAKSTDKDVKAFAQHMVKDHTKANEELMAAAKAKGLKVPTEPGVMHKGMKEKFEHQAADADFNHDFMEQMVKDHESAVALFRTASADTTLNVDLRALAKKTLPTLDEHLADAKKLEAKLDKSERSASDD
jgi:Predicted outer membrane protein